MGNMNSSSSNSNENSSILDYLDDDVLQLVCERLKDLVAHNETLPLYQRPEVSMLPLSLTCKRFRVLCLPYIFQIFNLECYSRNPWWEASNRMVRWNPDLSPHIREISINLCISIIYKDSWLSTWFISSLPGTLARALHHLSTSSPHLDKLSMRVEEDKCSLFEAAFAKIGLSFPSIRRLAITPANAGLMRICPNVTSLSIFGVDYLNVAGWAGRILGEAVKLPRLEGVLIDVICDVELMDTIVKLQPRIRTLVISSRNLLISFEKFVARLAQLRYVKVFVLPLVESLDIGFNPPGCGNVYFGPRGEEYRERVEREGREAEYRAAKAIFSQCPQLEELWFSKYSKVVRDDSGGELRWEYYYRDWECSWLEEF